MKIMLVISESRTPMLLKSDLEYWLSASVLFSISLVIAGSMAKANLNLGFLIWNLFLAAVPYLISKWMYRRICEKGSMLLFFLLFIAWLLFIPNSFYILTDLFHLGNFSGIPLWFELAMILSFAWNGLILGILSVRQMEKMMERYLAKRTELYFICPIMFLNSLGVYIGRYLRFNSWDVITNPLQLVTDISNLAFHPFLFKYAWGMVICFSIFITLVYLILKRLSKAIA